MVKSVELEYTISSGDSFTYQFLNSTVPEGISMTNLTGTYTSLLAIGSNMTITITEVTDLSCKVIKSYEVIDIEGSIVFTIPRM
ncbi:hypothetical protein CEE45_08945 [Candidatus Heimdallarchaeota archaeon B3_Heim]|nr:MAG: hypothetical protein CEE45_08945 [Candidatus Heimdallarchaeota archaeon B3_Heim]